MPKQFCPYGHDTFVVGRRYRKCMACDRARVSDGWQNPKRALRRLLRNLNTRMEVKRERIAALEKELGIVQEN